MPNWVKNTISTSVENFPKVLSALINDNDEADFQKLSPISEDLRNTEAGSGSYVDKTDKFVTGFSMDRVKLQDEILDPYLDKFYTGLLTQSEFVAIATKHIETEKPKDVLEAFKTMNASGYTTFLKGYFNTRRYGFSDWYSANCALWGTKWNASDSCVYEQDCKIVFDTAWSMPYPIIEKLSFMTPLYIAYADEDTGSNFGIYKVENGECTNILEEVLDKCSDVIGDYDMNIVNYFIASAIFGNDNDNILNDIDAFYDTDEECEGYFGMGKAELAEKARVILDKVVGEHLDKYLVR